MRRGGIGWICGAALMFGLAACTGSDPAGDPAGTSPISSARSASGPPPTAASSPAVSAPTGASTPATSARPVPVDQIPPGNPARWVPAGVPTTAKYREPGDVVPMFTQAMFKKTSEGALAAARYYIDAENWSIAVNDYTPVSIICDAKRCKLIAPYFTGLRVKNQHLRGGRTSTGPPLVLPAPKSSGAQWVVQLRIIIAPGSDVANQTGTVVKEYAEDVTLTNLYMKWSGSIWRVSQDVLAA